MRERLDQKETEQKLLAYPTLKNILGTDWLLKEFEKSIGQWSLVMGWLTSQEPIFSRWLSDLDCVLRTLSTSVCPATFNQIKIKITSHSDRANTKGVLSEIGIMIFLQSCNIRFLLDQCLIEGSRKDIDIGAIFSANTSVNIEVQWVSPSESSEIGAEVAAAFNEAYQFDFDEEEYRVKLKVFDKTPKFTENDITFVAIDCTTSPELGGRWLASPIGSAMKKTFTGKEHDGRISKFSKSNIDTTIRSLVDGVIWFQLEPGNCFMPINRNIIVNESSHFSQSEEIEKFTKLWLNRGDNK